MSITPSRTYKDAIDALNSLQTNPAVLEAMRAAGNILNPNAIPEMIDYLRRVGLEPSQLNVLNVIHITGTKGKGSTSAFTDSILRAARPAWTTGLYTSPHLVAVRERIRINGEPLSEEDFTRYFFEVWDLLQKNTKCETTTAHFMPSYFRFLTIMAFYTFRKRKVDATILEVGIGGRSDSTNIVPKPIVTGVTSLGYDHTTVLGERLSQIANQKGGIYKEGVPALTVEQPEEGMAELRHCASEQGASQFTVVDPLPSTITLGLAGVHQRSNASLAVQLVHMFLSITNQSTISGAAETKNNRIETLRSLPTSFLDGLKNAHWPGRCQTILDPKHEGMKWFLDGAHTKESLECCLEWFVSPGVGLPDCPIPEVHTTRVLIFNCTRERSASEFLKTILQKTGEQLTTNGSPEKKEEFFAKVIFCSNMTYASGFKGDIAPMAMSTIDNVNLKTQREIEAAWNKLVPTYSGTVHVLPSIEDAVGEALKTQNVNVLVTGSLHLVGGIIEVAGLADSAFSPSKNL